MARREIRRRAREIQNLWRSTAKTRRQNPLSGQRDMNKAPVLNRVRGVAPARGAAWLTPHTVAAQTCPGRPETRLPGNAAETGMARDCLLAKAALPAAGKVSALPGEVQEKRPSGSNEAGALVQIMPASGSMPDRLGMNVMARNQSGGGARFAIPGSAAWPHLAERKRTGFQGMPGHRGPALDR